jgi:hypothetical protein
MFNNEHYVPVLKWKKGEQGALSVLPDLYNSKYTPLIEVPFIETDYEKGRLSRSPEKHIENVISSLKGIKTEFTFIDLEIIEAHKQISDKLAASVFTSCPSRIKLIPVVSPDSGSVSISIAKLYQTNGLCYRMKSASFENMNRAISTLNQKLDNPKPENVDLVIDFASIFDYPLGNLKVLTKSVLSALPNIDRWRTLTLLASSFPYDLSRINRDTVQRIPRLEWINWLDLNGKVGRNLTYGDYPIAHPNLVALDFRFMDRSASIRYTSNEEWVVVKGRSVKVRAQSMQYQEKAQILISLPEYSGEGYSWGDSYIAQCARQEKTGNATIWRQVGVNHHIHLVLDQLASLS